MLDPISPHPIGHNTRDVRADVLADLRDLLQPFEVQRDRYLKSAAAAVVRDRGTAGDAADLIKFAGEIREKIQEKRMEITRPLRDAADAAKAHADDFWQPVDDEMARVLGLIDVFRTEEADRIAKQQREQDETMSLLVPRQPTFTPAIVVGRREHIDYSQRPTDGAPAQPVLAPREAKARPIRGTYGAKVTAAEQKTYVVTDLDLVPRWVLETDTVKTAIAAVAKSLAKHHPNIPGIAVSTADQTRIS